MHGTVFETSCALQNSYNRQPRVLQSTPRNSALGEAVKIGDQLDIAKAFEVPTFRARGSWSYWARVQVRVPCGVTWQPGR